MNIFVPENRSLKKVFIFQEKGVFINLKNFWKIALYGWMDVLLLIKESDYLLF